MARPIRGIRRRSLGVLALALAPTALGVSACSDAESPISAAPEIDWVALEGSCFTLGEDRGYAEERPAREACVEAFSISRTEITVAQFSAFVRATGYVTQAEAGVPVGEALTPGSAVFHAPEGPGEALSWWRFVDGASWRYPTGPGGEPANPDHPVVHITQGDAQAFAIWMGGRLPTEAEWEYAARGGLDGTLYAWDEAEGLALAARANTWQGICPYLDTQDDGYAGIAPVGQFPPNGFGLRDMIGNVWEWTATAYQPNHAADVSENPDRFDPAQPGRAVAVIKGGSFLCASSYCYRFRPAARQAQDLAFGTSHIGFRVVKD